MSIKIGASNIDAMLAVSSNAVVASEVQNVVDSEILSLTKDGETRTFSIDVPAELVTLAAKIKSKAELAETAEAKMILEHATEKYNRAMRDYFNKYVVAVRARVASISRTPRGKVQFAESILSVTTDIDHLTVSVARKADAVKAKTMQEVMDDLDAI